MKKDWYTFYKDRVNSTYQDYFEERYDPFLKRIKSLLTDKREIYELGCGIGSISKALSKDGISFAGIDKDPYMVRLANTNTNSKNFYSENILDTVLPYGTLKVTHGVLEHFEDAAIKYITNRCPNSIHYVPLDKYEKPSFGDERLLSVEYWLELVKPKAYELFNEDYDLMFIL